MQVSTEKLSVSAIKVELEFIIDADIDTVWNALTEKIDYWWRRDFFATTAKRFVLEPRLGGHLYEDLGNGEGVVWYQVQGIQSPNYLNLCGNIYPDFGGPTTSLLQIKLETQGQKTQFKLCDGIMGHLGESSYDNVRSGWVALFEQGMKDFIEGAE